MYRGISKQILKKEKNCSAGCKRSISYDRVQYPGYAYYTIRESYKNELREKAWLYEFIYLSNRQHQICTDNGLKSVRMAVNPECEERLALYLSGQPRSQHWSEAEYGTDEVSARVGQALFQDISSEETASISRK